MRPPREIDARLLEMAARGREIDAPGHETVAREGEIDPRSDEIDAQAGRNERVARRNRLSFLRGAAWLSRNGCEVQRKSLKIFANFA